MPRNSASAIKLAIAVPTYNEAKNIPKLVKGIENAVSKTGIDCSLYIIDDNSPDGTGDVAEKLAASEKTKNFSIKVIHRENKQGLGKAYVDGFSKIMHKDCTHILQMDADLSHDPKYIPEFIEAAGRADFVVGSRYIKGGDTPDWSLRRKLLSRFGNLYARIFLGNQIHDYTGGFNMYSVALLRKIDLATLQAGGYGFLIELKHLILRQLPTIHEIPIIFIDRQHGVSKIPRSTILKNLMLVPKMRFTAHAR